MTTFAFPPSAFIPVVVGLFGLGTGYFIWGGQALFGYPKPVPEVEKTMGMWGFWMPGFMQFMVLPLDTVDNSTTPRERNSGWLYSHLTVQAGHFIL